MPGDVSRNARRSSVPDVHPAVSPLSPASRFGSAGRDAMQRLKQPCGDTWRRCNRCRQRHEPGDEYCMAYRSGDLGSRALSEALHRDIKQIGKQRTQDAVGANPTTQPKGTQVKEVQTKSPRSKSPSKQKPTKAPAPAPSSYTTTIRSPQAEERSGKSVSNFYMVCAAYLSAPYAKVQVTVGAGLPSDAAG